MALSEKHMILAKQLPIPRAYHTAHFNNSYSSGTGSQAFIYFFHVSLLQGA